MGQTVNVNFKLDADVKKGMETACSDMGLSMSAAFTIFEKKWHEKNVYHLKYLRIHFTLKVRYLEQIAHDIKTGKASFVEHDLIEEFLNRLSFQISKS